MAFILSVLGAILVIEGIPYFAFPARVKEWAFLIQEVSDRNLRVMGIFSMAAGLVILYIVRTYLG